MTLRILHWLSRLLLAGVFIYSGYAKIQPSLQFSVSITDGKMPEFHFAASQASLQFAVAITGYKLGIPDSLILPIATYFPWLEIALGLLLLIGWKIRYVSVGAAGLMLFFIVLLSVTYFRGIETNCGCFGFGDRISLKTIARDSSFFIPALFLVVETRLRKRPASAAAGPSSVSN